MDAFNQPSFVEKTAKHSKPLDLAIGILRLPFV
jgi:hypothetical protein